MVFEVTAGHFGGSYNPALHLFMVCYDVEFWLGARRLRPKRTSGVCSDQRSTWAYFVLFPHFAPLRCASLCFAGVGLGGAPRSMRLKSPLSFARGDF